MNGIDIKYLNYINQFDDFHYLLYRIAYRTAPTIMNIKPSFLITFQNTPRDVINTWTVHKEYFCMRLGLQYFEIKKSSGFILVLFYKEKILKRQLTKIDNSEFLLTMGYSANMELEEKLHFLRKRFELGCPHEIGIFLGFPLEDVEAFIKNKGSNCLLCRYWKVYHNPEKAEQTFQQYDLARIMVMFVMIDPMFTLVWSRKKYYHIIRQRSFYS